MNDEAKTPVTRRMQIVCGFMGCNGPLIRSGRDWKHVIEPDTDHQPVPRNAEARRDS